MDIGDFKKGYQPRTNIKIIKDGKGDLVADSHSILASRKNRFSQLFNAHGINDDRQTEMHTAEPLVTEPSAFEVEIAIEKLKGHKSPGIDQIPTELIKTGGRKIRSEITKLTDSIWNKKTFPEEWKKSIILPIKTYRTDCSHYRGISLLSNTQTHCIQHPAVKVNSLCRGNYWVSSMCISTQQVNY
jgi:hypothetical protein